MKEHRKSNDFYTEAGVYGYFSLAEAILRLAMMDYLYGSTSRKNEVIWWLTSPDSNFNQIIYLNKTAVFERFKKLEKRIKKSSNVVWSIMSNYKKIKNREDREEFLRKSLEKNKMLIEYGAINTKHIKYELNIWEKEMERRSA